MKHALINQYALLREDIISNVKTIELLVAQSADLKVSCERIGHDQSDIRNDLFLQIDRIEETLGLLITQTDSLLDRYRDFVEATFSS